MNNSKHTPGEWTVDYDHNQNFTDIIKVNVIAGKKKIFSASNGGGDFEEQEANAKLIAAAPELLEVLEKIKEWHTMAKIARPKFPSEILFAIIKKATE